MVRATKAPSKQPASKQTSKPVPPAKRARATTRAASPRHGSAKATKPLAALATAPSQVPSAPVARDRGVLMLVELVVEQWVKHKARVDGLDVAILGRYGHLPSKAVLDAWLTKLPQDKTEPGWTTAAHARLAIVFATQGDEARARAHLDAAHRSLPKLGVTRMVANDHLAEAHTYLAAAELRCGDQEQGIQRLQALEQVVSENAGEQLSMLIAAACWAGLWSKAVALGESMARGGHETGLGGWAWIEWAIEAAVLADNLEVVVLLANILRDRVPGGPAAFASTLRAIAQWASRFDAPLRLAILAPNPFMQPSTFDAIVDGLVASPRTVRPLVEQIAALRGPDIAEVVLEAALCLFRGDPAGSKSYVKELGSHGKGTVNGLALRGLLSGGKPPVDVRPTLLPDAAELERALAKLSAVSTKLKRSSAQLVEPLIRLGRSDGARKILQASVGVLELQNKDRRHMEAAAICTAYGALGATKEGLAVCKLALPRYGDILCSAMMEGAMSTQRWEDAHALALRLQDGSFNQRKSRLVNALLQPRLEARFLAEIPPQ